MSDLDGKVRKLNRTKHWRKFYKDRAQKLKNSDHNLTNADRTRELTRTATTAIGIRKRQLQDDWPKLIEIAASTAVPKLNLPAKDITDAAVMLFTCRTMRCLGLDECSTKAKIYQSACSAGGVQETTLTDEILRHVESLVIRYRDEARLTLMRELLTWLFVQADVEDASAGAKKVVGVYKKLEAAGNMAETFITAHENHQRVLNHLEEEARNHHISDLIPPAIDATQ